MTFHEATVRSDVAPINVSSYATKTNQPQLAPVEISNLVFKSAPYIKSYFSLDHVECTILLRF
jgi:hypothetical protein